MAEVIKMPKMSDTMQVGVLVAWHKAVGDTVQIGDVLADVETDKATMELEAYEEGTLLYLGPKPKEKVPVGGVLAIIGEPGEDYQALLAAEATPTQANTSLHKTKLSQNSASAPASLPPITVPNQPPNPPDSPSVGKPVDQTPTFQAAGVKASPLAKKMAEAQGVDLSTVQGSGPKGRVVKRDLLGVQASITTSRHREGYRDETPDAMRNTIAQRLIASKQQAPHFYLTVKVDMDEAVALRSALQGQLKVSFNDLIVYATAKALRQHPEVNVAWLDDQTIRYYDHIHLGIAVALPAGLVVPVWKFADQRTLRDTAQGIRTLIEQARQQRLKHEVLQGSTFTVSNLGMLGVSQFTAILNPPAACILAVGSIEEAPCCRKGQVVVGHTLQLTLSCDHRVVDGAMGAAFLQTLKRYLEAPAQLLL